jgi:diguanylate cyclase (GGDEF)-like protein/PAS domain S-box-containing protein
MHLRAKIVIIFMVLSLLPLFIAGGIAYFITRNTIEKNLGSNLRQIARETIQETDRDLYELYQNVNAWSGLDVMKEVLSGDLDGNVSNHLIGLQREYPHLSGLFALDSKGIVVASGIPGLIGRNLRTKRFYENSIGGHRYVEDAHFEELVGKWVVTFSFPIKAKFLEEKTIGLLCAFWKLDGLDGLINSGLQLADPSLSAPLTLLIRSDGLVISASNAVAGLSPLQDNLIEEGMKSAAMASRRMEGALIEDFPGVGESLLGFSYSNGYRDFSGLNWAALVAQDTRTGFSSITRLNQVLFGVSILVGLGVLTVSLIVSRKMTGPILEIAQVARRVSLGDLEGRADYNSSDEIGFLAGAFNQMIRDLKGQREQLVDKHYVDSILANMLNSLIVADSEGRIMTVNKATLDLLGWTVEEIVGIPMASVFDEEFLKQWPRVVLSEGDLGNYETVYKTKSGGRVPVLFSSSSIRDDRGRTQGIVCVAQDISEMKKAEAALAEQAARDSLTGLYNRRYFDQRIREELARADRAKQPLALLLCDMDKLKIVNDTKGHQVGDEALKAIAKSILDSTRGVDVAFRWGGDEFMVILPQTAREGARVAAARIRTRLHKIRPPSCPELDVSVGIVVYPEHGVRDDELIKMADLALYIAKKRGDKTHVGAEEYQLNEHVVNVVFQPIVSLGPGEGGRSDQTVAYEALSRDPEGRLSVLDLFKKYEAIGKLEELKEICFKKQIQRAKELGLGSVFINVDFVLLSKVEMLCPKPPDLEVILEISEREPLHDLEEHLETAKRWRKLGYKFALDDFGAGFISLPFIARLVPEYIKLDRSTVVQTVSSRQFNHFMRGLVAALRNYVREGIIAEGIETEKELKAMKELGITLVQGYMFGRPGDLPKTAGIVSPRTRRETGPSSG